MKECEGECKYDNEMIVSESTWELVGESDWVSKAMTLIVSECERLSKWSCLGTWVNAMSEFAMVKTKRNLTVYWETYTVMHTYL